MPRVTLDLRPLSARSAVLSLLLGTHPAELPARHLVLAAEQWGISEATLRVALTRMVASGDLLRTDATYRLSARLLERQRRQDAAVEPAVTAYDGTWELVVITHIGADQAERLERRRQLQALRLGEFREGLWLRPANLARTRPDDWPPDLVRATRRFTATPDEDPAVLVRELWDLDGWTSRGVALRDAFAAATAAPDRFMIAAAVVRHLLADPILPPDLLPPGWPGAALREQYAAYRTELEQHVAAVTGR